MASTQTNTVRKPAGTRPRTTAAAAKRSAASALTRMSLMAAVASQSLDDKVIIDRVVREGLAMEIVEQMSKAGEVNIEAMILNNVIPRKTWESAVKSGTKLLTPANSERLLRVARVTALARQAFGRENADLWLARTTPSLGNQPPIGLLATESGARAVELLLGRIEHGFAA